MLLRKFSHHLFSGQISKMWMFAGAKAYNTRDSQDVSDPSTNRAQRCLTCQIGRDGVFSARYGRKRKGWSEGEPYYNKNLYMRKRRVPRKSPSPKMHTYS